METLLNPYIAGAPVVEPSMFFGRQDVFEWIERNLAGKYVHHILVIHGQRRVGKTSVLKQIPHVLPSRYLQVFFDLQGRTSTTLDRFLWWLAREIARVMKQELGLTITVPERSEFAEDIDILYTRFLPEVRLLLGNKFLLLTFDEFDTLEQAEIRDSLARPLIDYLKRLFEMEGLAFIFSIGSSGRKLENMQAAYTDFFKTALYKKISFLSAEDCARLVTRPVEGILTYAPEAVACIYQITAGHPYFTQLVCHELFSRCQKTGARAVDSQEVEAILGDVIERGTVNLKFVWDEAAPLEKWALACLAHGGEGVVVPQLEDMLRRQRVYSSQDDLNAALIHLQEKDVLTADHRFVVALMRLWLQQNRPLERVREELVEVNPISERYIEIAEEYRAQGRGEKALESLQQALTVDPGNLRAQVGLAALYMEKKEYAQAAAAFEKALAIDEEDVTARSGLCDSTLALGDEARRRQSVAEAQRAYLKVLEVNAEQSEARQRLAEMAVERAEIAWKTGQEETALAAFEEALRWTPEDVALQARADQARRAMLEKVIATWLAEGERKAAAGHWEAALAALGEAEQLAPEDGRILQARAAVESARRARQLEVLSQTARDLQQAERWDEAQAAWQEYLALDPPDHPAAEAALQEVEQQRFLAQSYAEAQAALQAKDYVRASGLLKKIVLQDETYRDAARLLAQAIEAQRKRRRFWQDWAIFKRRPRRKIPTSTFRRLGASLGILGLLAALAWGASRLVPAWLTRLPWTAYTPSKYIEPIADWGQSFAAPLVEYIDQNPAEFYDDFTTHQSIWTLPGHVDILDGVMRIRESWEPVIVDADHLVADDFALRLMVIHEGIRSGPPVLLLGFRAYETRGYRFRLKLFESRPGEADWVVQRDGMELLSGSTRAYRPDQWNTLLLLARGDRFGVILNDQPVVFFSDAVHRRGQIYLGAEGQDELGLEVIQYWSFDHKNSALFEPEQAREFARPLLTSLQGTAPDFEDDFAAQKQEWGQPKNVDFSSAEQLLGFIPCSGQEDIAEIGGLHLAAQDFALQFDLRFDHVEGGTMFFTDLRANDQGGVGIELIVSEETPGQAMWKIGGHKKADFNGLGPAKIFPVGEWNHFDILFQYDELVILLNGEPLVHLANNDATGNQNLLGVKTDGCAKVLLDNLKFWRLGTSVAAAPAWVKEFAEPIMADIQARKPDFEEDFFRTDSEQWAKGDVIIAEDAGFMVFESAENVLPKAGRQEINARDFALQFEFMPVLAAGEELSFSTVFRYAEDSGSYALDLLASRDQGKSMDWKVWRSQDEKTLASGNTQSLRLGETNTLLLIALGDQFAIYLNGEPLGYFKDNAQPGEEILLVGEKGKVYLDNLKFWKLGATVEPTPAFLPDTAYAMALLAQVESQTPYFEDNYAVKLW